MGADAEFLSEPLGSAPDARADFLLLRQKKVAKEKATPGRRPAVGGVPCATRPERRLRNSGFALKQCSPTTPLKAPLLSVFQGDSKPPLHNRSRVKQDSVLLMPSASSSSAGRNGKEREDCLRAVGPSSAAPRWDRAAQRTRRSRATRWARLFFGYFLLARQKKVPRRSTAKPTVSAARKA